jgi:hypothetical protein
MQGEGAPSKQSCTGRYKESNAAQKSSPGKETQEGSPIYAFPGIVWIIRAPDLQHPVELWAGQALHCMPNFERLRKRLEENLSSLNLHMNAAGYCECNR